MAISRSPRAPRFGGCRNSFVGPVPKLFLVNLTPYFLPPGYECVINTELSENLPDLVPMPYLRADEGTLNSYRYAGPLTEFSEFFSELTIDNVGTIVNESVTIRMRGGTVTQATVTPPIVEHKVVTDWTNPTSFDWSRFIFHVDQTIESFENRRIVADYVPRPLEWVAEAFNS